MLSQTQEQLEAPQSNLQEAQSPNVGVERWICPLREEVGLEYQQKK